MAPILILTAEGLLIAVGAAILGTHYLGSEKMRNRLYQFYRHHLNF
jgi:hypothetical protein